MKRIFSLILILILALSTFSLAIAVSAVNVSELEDAIAEADQKLAESSKYTDESVGMLQGAYDDAVSALELAMIDMLDQNQIDMKTAVLRDRIDNLKLASGGGSSLSGADKTELQAAITKAKSFKKQDYNVMNNEWDLFQNKIAVAESAYINELYTQNQIDSFTSVLEAAIEDMEMKKKTTIKEEATQSTESSFESESFTVQATAPIQTTPPTEKHTVVYPKYTAPISEGGFVYLGCDASVAISALAVVGIIGAAVAIKKKED